MIADHLGSPTTVALGGVACIAGSAAFWLRLPALRHEAMQIMTTLRRNGGAQS
jgi:hypothetical protein